MELEKTAMKNMGVQYVKKLILAYVLTTVLLAFFAFLMYQFDMSYTAGCAMLLVAYLIPTMFAGWRMGKQVEKRQFVWGMLLGLGYFLLLLLVSFIGNNYFFGNYQKLVLVGVICIFSGMFGGMLS